MCEQSSFSGSSPSSPSVMARRRLLSLDPRALEMEDDEVNEARYELILLHLSMARYR
jgi:hypothetical protein